MRYAAADLPEALVQDAQALAQATQPSLNALYAWRWRRRVSPPARPSMARGRRPGPHPGLPGHAGADAAGCGARRRRRCAIPRPRSLRATPEVGQ